MVVTLAYGADRLAVTLDDGWPVDVIEPKFMPALPAPEQALRLALEQPIASAPLRQRAPAQGKVGIIVNDITRPTPNRLILNAILEQLAHVEPRNVIIFVGLGTHRRMTDAELAEMLGADLLARFTVVQNDAFDPQAHVCLGRSRRGNDIFVHRELAACALKILTGFIEPHFFAGFSGGGKALMPGMAAQATVLRNHSAAMIAHPQATWGITHGNPIWEEVREAARMAGDVFLLNVTLNRDKQITAVFAGALDAAHAAGCRFVRDSAMIGVERPYDIVLTSNSGYPLDQNVYQCVKGMSAAAQVVRPGGAIVMAAECRDGIPSHGRYGALLQETASPRQLLDRIQEPGFHVQDQWQVQLQAQIQLKADVYFYSHLLSPEQVWACWLRPVASLPETVRQLMAHYGPQARIAVLPEGPQTIPYIAAGTSVAGGSA